MGDWTAEMAQGPVSHRQGPLSLENMGEKRDNRSIRNPGNHARPRVVPALQKQKQKQTKQEQQRRDKEDLRLQTL